MVYNFDPWQGASRCTGGPEPGAVALMKVILRRHPRGRSLGIYNCRTVRGGSTTSLHGEGRALDVGFPMNNGRGSAAGYALVKQLGERGQKLGIQAIIYDRKIWSAKSPGGRAYTGAAPHYDHVHVELTKDAARTLNVNDIEKILSGKAARIALLRRRIRRYQRQIEEWQRRIKRIQNS